MESIEVSGCRRLKVRCTLFKAQHPISDRLILIHHGICHTLEQYRQLIDELNALGISVVMVEQRSEQAWLKNFLGLSRYRENLAIIVRTLENRGYRIGCYLLHSMGAEIGEEMQQAYPELRRPTVFLAPIPHRGALPITWRILWRHPWSYVKAVFTLDIHSLADTREEVRELFFDPNTPQQLVNDTTVQLKHAPFWAYLQLVLRPVIRPWIENDKLPKLLLLSPTDEIFHAAQYPPTRRLYPQLEEHSLSGGHDFFLQHAHETADRIKSFLERHGVIRKPAVPEPHFSLHAAKKEGKGESERV